MKMTLQHVHVVFFDGMVCLIVCVCVCHYSDNEFAGAV
jgi:hypothetical protein